MPFGRKVTPRIFTKLTGSVVKILRFCRVQVVAYLDDWFIYASSKELCIKAFRETMSLLSNLGFCINMKKSLLILRKSSTG